MLGVVTSLVNHGGTHVLYKWADRLWMLLGAATDTVYIWNHHAPSQRPGLLVFQASFIASFFLAKWRIQRARRGEHAAPGVVGNGPHLFTHLGASALHVWLLYRVCRGKGVLTGVDGLSTTV